MLFGYTRWTQKLNSVGQYATPLGIVFYQNLGIWYCICWNQANFNWFYIEWLSFKFTFPTKYDFSGRSQRERTIYCLLLLPGTAQASVPLIRPNEYRMIRLRPGISIFTQPNTPNLFSFVEMWQNGNISRGRPRNLSVEFHIALILNTALVWTVASLLELNMLICRGFQILFSCSFGPG